MTFSSLPKFNPASFAWMACPSKRFPNHRLPVSAGMEAVWSAQMLPPHSPLLEKVEYAEILYCWWLIDGIKHHPSVPFYFDETLLDILGEHVIISNGHILPLWLYRYWQSSYFIQERFNLTSDESIAELLIWAYTGGAIPAELLLGLPLPPESLEFLQQKISGCAFSVPRGLKALWSCNIQGAQMFDATQLGGCAALVIWFLAFQKTILPYIPLCIDSSLADTLLQYNEEGLPLFAEGALLVRPDAKPYFPLKSLEEQQSFFYWISTEFVPHLHGHPLINHVLLELAPDSLACEPAPSALEPQLVGKNGSSISSYIGSLKAKNHKISLGKMESGGINIVGFARGELGLGEDVRMAVKSCGINNVPFVVLEPPFAIASRQDDLTVHLFIEEEPYYSVNLIFLPGSESFRLFLDMGDGLFKARYTIGAWAWELPNWPPELRCTLPLAQEFWLSSRFTMDTMLRATASPAYFVPMAVELPDFTPLGRLAHALPEGVFIFLYIFDGLSWGSRKNPLGAIKAFQDAFPMDTDVRLVIKTMNATSDMPFWKAVLKATARDPRILCINEVYTKQQLLSLFSCCDAYISLHRAEGFGRTIAEAMLLELPVIATAWSGNADFTTSETAFAIGGKLVPVREGEYIFWEGQEWCEPDHDEAVTAMRECVTNSALAKAKAKAGRQLILEQYSAHVVGMRYRHRLESIGVI